MNKPVIYVYRVRNPKPEGYTTPWMPELPSFGSTFARGLDVRAFLPNGPICIEPMETVVIPTGLIIALPEHSAMLVCSRSGLSTKGIIVTNAPGVIDSDYRGECKVIMTYLHAPSREIAPFVVSHGDRIAQWVYLPPVYNPYPDVFAGSAPSIIEVDDPENLPVPDSNRVGGFGSTGIK